MASLEAVKAAATAVSSMAEIARLIMTSARLSPLRDFLMILRDEAILTA